MKKGYLIVLIILAVGTLSSLALNGVVIFGLLRARRITLEAQQVAQDTVTETRAVITGIGEDTFAYTVELEQEIPIATSIPFEEEITVPINTTIPINTTVVVPIDLGITSYDLQVPIRTIIPVDLEVVVPISQTVDVATTVPLDVDIPIEIPIADTPLVGYMEELDAALARLGEGLTQLEGRLEKPLSREGE